MSQARQPQSPWWRRSRGRDEAQARAGAAQAAAGEAFFDLDTAMAGLHEPVAVHQASMQVATAAGARARSSAQPPPPDRLVAEWEALKAHTDSAFAQYLSATSDFDLARDPEEAVAVTKTAQFESCTQVLRAALPQVRRFAETHGAVLDRARNDALAGPRLLAEATASLERATAAVNAARAAGVTDTGIEAVLRAGIVLAREAAAARDQHAFAIVRTKVAQVTEHANRVATQTQGLEGRVHAVREGLLATKTRVDALHTQRERLDGVMSMLRRNFSAASWAHINDVPARATADLVVVTEGLDALDAAIALRPLDVAAAETRLRQVRASARAVGDYVEMAKSTLDRLQSVATDPGAAVHRVRRELLDVRKVLLGLPPDRQSRFAGTLDSLARRVEALGAGPRGVNPDWGALIREMDSIMVGLGSLLESMRRR